MSYALEQKQDLIFSAKDTISKVYDRNFQEIFKQIFMEEFMEKFEAADISYSYCLIDDAVSRAVKSPGGYVWACQNISYSYCLIDDAVSRAVKSPGGYVWACQNYDGDVMSDMLATAYGSAAMMTSVLVSPDGCYEYEAKSPGGYVWACQNYDGDVMSDMLATAYGSAAMMTSVLVSPDGCYEYEAAHGTVRRHYYQYLEGGVASTNPLAIIMAWANALEKRGELDRNQPLQEFGACLQKITIETVESHGTVRRHYYQYLEGGVASTNPLAIIMAWANALEKRGELDRNQPLQEFGACLQKITIQTVESGIMTKDLKKVTTLPEPHVVTGLQFIETVQKKLWEKYGI